MKAQKVSKCIHCGEHIINYDGRIWHDGSLVFPQYCTGRDENGSSKLHEPTEIKMNHFELLEFPVSAEEAVVEELANNTEENQ